MSLKKKVRFELPVISIGDSNKVPVNKRYKSKTQDMTEEITSKNDEILFYYPKFPRLIPTEYNISSKSKQKHIKHCWICSSIYSDIILNGNKLQDPKKLRHIQKGHQSTMEMSNMLLQVHLPIYSTKLNKRPKTSKYVPNLHEDFYNWRRSHFTQKNFKQQSKERRDSDEVKLLQSYCNILDKY